MQERGEDKDTVFNHHIQVKALVLIHRAYILKGLVLILHLEPRDLGLTRLLKRGMS